MKINLLKLNHRIKNKTRSLPSIHAYNNDNSLNNISSTTNASALKNTQVNKSIIIEKYPKKYRALKKIKLNNNKNISTNSKNLFFSTKNINKKTLEILENADYIMKQSSKFKYLALNEKKYKNKNLELELNRKLSEKNYCIKYLKITRNQINEKEFLINKSLKDYNEQLNSDYKNFNNYVRNSKNNHNYEEYTINRFKEIREKKEKLIEDELLLNKRLEIALEKKIKEFYEMKDYGIFFHRLIDRPFLYGSLPTINSSTKDYDKIANLIFNLYEKRDKYNLLPSELQDEDLLFKKYRFLEDSLISSLNLKETIEKEIINNRVFYDEELKQNKLSLIGYENEFNYLTLKKYEIKNEFTEEKIDECNSLDNCLKYVTELGKQIIPEEEIPINFEKKIKKLTIDEYYTEDLLIYIENMKKLLANKEYQINNNILKIENVLNNGEKKDKILMEKIINKQKYFNKVEQKKILNDIIKEKKYLKNKKIFEKYKAIAINGRKIFFNYSIKSKDRPKKNIKRKKEEDNFKLENFDFLNESNN